MKAIVLAAGYATRLYPLTIDTPKALLPLGGRVMMDYLVDQIATLPNMDEAHIVSNARFFAQFRAWADEAQPRYPHMKLVVWNDGTLSNEDRLGAVGDIWFTIEQAKLDDELLVAASDNFFTFPLIDYYRAFKQVDRDMLLMTHISDRDTLKGFAVATLDENNRVVGLVEKPQDPPTDIGVFALYLYRRDTLPLIKRYLDEGNSPDAPGHLPEWLYHFRDVRGYLFDGECIDIGTPEMYRAVQQRFEEGGDLAHE